MTELVLASSSSSRLKILQNAGLDPRVVIPDVDEDTVMDAAFHQHGPLGSADIAVVLARAKAESVVGEDALILACDSVLEMDGWTYGKPEDADDVIKRWQSMRGRSGTLHTGHWLTDQRSQGTGRSLGAVASTVVHFADIADAEIEAYADSGEPLRAVGGFTVDGLGGAFVSRIEGDYHNVAGLSLPLLRQMLADLGISWPSLWKRP